MNYKNLKQHAELCQLECDETAYKLLKQKEMFELISSVQSICDFNLSWLYLISPDVAIHKKSLSFLKTHLKRFTRKITIKEMFKFDSLIYWHNPETFEKFKTLI